MSGDRVDRRAAWLAAVLVLTPVIFNAIALIPELRPIPRINDESWHYLFIQRASAALSSGANPFDPWISELECGFPYFTFYQHMPHLAVVALSRLTLGRVSLIEMLCIVRYLLMVGFPLTVYWSMRMMEFSMIASATGAAFSSLIAAPRVLGLEYESYVWNGWGLYTQLWAMHLLFISTACIERLMLRGVGFASVVISVAMLVVSHPFYAGIAALTAIALVAADVFEEKNGSYRFAGIRRRSVWLTLTGAAAALITAYFWLPFILGISNFRLAALPGMITFSPAPQPGAFDLVLRARLLDNDRLPVLTLMAAAGIGLSVVTWRRRTSRLAVAIFVCWLGLYLFAPLMTGGWSGQLPGAKRLVGPVQMGAILLIGIAGEHIWSVASRFGKSWQPIAASAVMVAMMIPALRERYGVYRIDAEKIARFSAVSEDANWRDIVATLKSIPPGRTYLAVSDPRGPRLLARLLLYDGLQTLQSASGLSFNAGLRSMFNDRSQSDYDVFDVRYVIAFAGFEPPPFLTLIRSNPS